MHLYFSGLSFNELASLKLSGKSLDRINNSNGTWDMQAIEDASGTVVNLDKFSVIIDHMPSSEELDSPEELLSYFRMNLNDFVKKFTPYDIPYDVDKWNSSDPISAILQIQMAPFDKIVDGDVICSQSSECCWVFTTLRGPWYASGYHPVSGNRQFGFELDDAGVRLYTKGADRTTTWYHGINGSKPALAKADELWISMQDALVKFVRDKGGVARIDAQNSHQTRVDWKSIRRCLQSEEPIY